MNLFRLCLILVAIENFVPSYLHGQSATDIIEMLKKNEAAIPNSGKFVSKVVTQHQNCEMTVLFDAKTASIYGEAFLNQGFPVGSLRSVSTPILGRFRSFQTESKFQLHQLDRFSYIEKDSEASTTLISVLPSKWLSDSKLGNLPSLLSKMLGVGTSGIACTKSNNVLTVEFVGDRSKKSAVMFKMETIEGIPLLTHFRMDSGLLSDGKYGPVFEGEYKWIVSKETAILSNHVEWNYASNAAKQMPLREVSISDFGPSTGSVPEVIGDMPFGTSMLTVANGGTRTEIVGGEEGKLENRLRTSGFELGVRLGIHSK